MGSRGRRSGEYVRVRRMFQTGNYICWICGERPGVTVDHDPPLGDTDPALWRGTWRPACKPCQDRQGAAITNRRRQRWTF